MSDEHLVVRTPISVWVPDGPLDALRRFGVLLGADRVAEATPGIEDDGFLLVGPRTTPWVRDLIARRLGRDLPAPRAREDVRAWAVYLPSDTDPSVAPMVMQFRLVEALGDVPVLVAEAALKPGELLVVPESSDVVVALSGFESPDRVRNVRWWSVAGGEAAPVPGRHPLRSTQRGEVDPHRPLAHGRRVHLDRPLLSGEPGAAPDLDLRDASASVQVGPVTSDLLHELLADSLPRAPWTRREGEIYTQDSLDLVAWIRSGRGPHELLPLVDALESDELVRRIARLTGRDLVANREVFAYRLRPGERILVHADSRERGQLDVRMNWLVSSPEDRPIDMRFWGPDRPDALVFGFPAQANSAVLFRMGESNPHDVCPVPRQAAGCRYNVVLTFGRHLERP